MIYKARGDQSPVWIGAALQGVSPFQKQIEGIKGSDAQETPSRAFRHLRTRGKKKAVSRAKNSRSRDRNM